MPLPLAFRLGSSLLTLYSYDVRLGKPQARCNHLCLNDHLSPFLPCLCLVAVIGHLSDNNHLEALPKRLCGVLSNRSKRHNPVEDRREIVVLVGVPVEAPAVDGHIKADDSAAASGLPKCWISCEVADDGDLVHNYLQTEEQGHSLRPYPRCLMRCWLLVCLVVGVDDFLLDASSSAHLVAVGLSPCTDLRDVVPAVSSATSPPAVSSAASCRRLSFNFTAVLNVGFECVVEP